MQASVCPHYLLRVTISQLFHSRFSKFGYLLYISKIELFQHGQEDDDVPSIKFEYDRELCQLHGT